MSRRFTSRRGRRTAFLGSQGVVFEVNETHAIRFLCDEFMMLKSLAYDPAVNPDTFPHPVDF
jgi:hypothetical protein